MSTYRVKEQFEWNGETHEAGKELELTEEEAANIGSSYVDPASASSEQSSEPPTGVGKEGSQNETDNPPSNEGGEQGQE